MVSVRAWSYTEIVLTEKHTKNAKLKDFAYMKRNVTEIGEPSVYLIIA